jgi:hypothetical protein
MCCQCPLCGEERRQGQSYNSVQFVLGLNEVMLQRWRGGMSLMSHRPHG